MRDLCKVVHIFDPCQLLLLSKQCATSRWQIYVDLATENGDLMMLLHFPACSRGKAIKTGSAGKGSHRPASSLCGYQTFLFHAWISPMTRLCNILSLNNYVFDSQVI